MSATNATLLPSLLAQVREAWTNQRDTALVHELAETHPDHADALFDYLDLLVELDLDDQTPDTRGRAAFAQAVEAWRLRRFPATSDEDTSDEDGDAGGNHSEDEPGGGQPGERDDNPPRPLLGLIKSRAQVRAREVEARTGLKPLFITKSNQYAAHLSPAWRRKVVDTCHEAFPQISRADLEAAYDEGYAPQSLAASRDTAFSQATPTPAEILDQCGITDPAERARWLRLAELTDVDPNDRAD